MHTYIINIILKSIWLIVTFVSYNEANEVTIILKAIFHFLKGTQILSLGNRRSQHLCFQMLMPKFSPENPLLFSSSPQQQHQVLKQLWKDVNSVADQIQGLFSLMLLCLYL